MGTEACLSLLLLGAAQAQGNAHLGSIRAAEPAIKASIPRGVGADVDVDVDVEHPEDLVDITMGTWSRIDYSTGSVLPFVGRPWGMNQWAPQTNNYHPNGHDQKSWWFHPEDKELYGIRCTHQPSPWINDYGNFLVSAEMGLLKTNFPNKATTFRVDKYSPYELDYTLDTYCDTDGNCMTLNLTGTSRGAMIHLTFPPFDEEAAAAGYDQTRRVRVLLSSNSTDSIDFDANSGRIFGFTQANNGGVPMGYPYPPPSSSATCQPQGPFKNLGFSGNDLYHFGVDEGDVDKAAMQCQTQCCNEPKCLAWGLDYGSSTSTGGRLGAAPDGGDLPTCMGHDKCCWIKSMAGGAHSGQHISGWKKGYGPDDVQTMFHHFFELETTPVAAGGDVLQRVNDNMFTNGLEAYLEFPPTVQSIEVRIGTSFISGDQARLNLDRELPRNKTFTDIAQESRARWNSVLGVVKVQGGEQGDPRGDKGRLVTFYSSMYRAAIFPRSLAEMNSTGHTIHWSPYDDNGNVFDGEIATDSGFWDAYRTVYQLGALIHPLQYNKLIHGWMNAYREQGWLPGWPSPGERGAMAATMQDCIVADAIIRGVPGLNVSEAYQAIRKDAFTVRGKGSQKGRAGLDDYIKYGYLPDDGDNSNQVAATLNYMLADYSVALAASFLGHDEDAKVLFERASKWRLLFDAKSKGGIKRGIPGFFRPVLKNGSFASPFDALSWGGQKGEYTEASPYQYRFYVPYDPSGLASAYGSSAQMCAALEEMMTRPATFRKGNWGLHHEQVEMVENCFGEYEHNNQPVHHVLYMAKGAGCPSLGQKWLRVATEVLYNEKVGFSGDEDNGEMASWFVLSALGLYQLVPGTPYYEIGSPLFEKAEITLPNKAKISIVAPGNTRDTPYVASVSWNGVPLHGLRVNYTDLQDGGQLYFNMTSDPKQAEEFYAVSLSSESQYS